MFRIPYEYIPIAVAIFLVYTMGKAPSVKEQTGKPTHPTEIPGNTTRLRGYGELIKKGKMTPQEQRLYELRQASNSNYQAMGALDFSKG